VSLETLPENREHVLHDMTMSMALKCIESERNWLITGSGTRWVKICDVEHFKHWFWCLGIL